MATREVAHNSTGARRRVQVQLRASGQVEDCVGERTGRLPQLRLERTTAELFCYLCRSGPCSAARGRTCGACGLARWLRVQPVVVR
eukprot:scaffold4482_cov133-Isochrysis_galbana.AAC.5